ncbi:MAG: 2-C-methyl-D-erythritol 4-phosphate cytidylyltransferase [Lachnospiraceae bacterium]|nr:2-C-methyl-D-erythritol 4-phosphate cytidylyltransferase [Lachnospiraceae bacterium]
MNIALVFAGGTGQRMKNSAKPKQFLELYGKPIIIYTLEVFEKNDNIDKIVIPCVAGWEDYLRDIIKKFNITKVDKILTGGKDTQESKMKALNYLKGICQDDDIVLLHDAVRPLVTNKIIDDNIKSVREYGNAITAVPFSETGIISDDREYTEKTIVRNTLFIAKAPQSFYFKDVFKAHQLGEKMDYRITIDTCSLMTELGVKLHMVQCETTNIKITTPEDYYVFKALVDLRESQDIFGL